MMLNMQQPDISQKAALQQAGWFPRTPEEYAAEIFDIDYDFSFPPAETSTKFPGFYSYEDFSDEDLVTTAPYSAILKGEAEEIFSENDSTQRLFVDTVVSEIQQDEKQVMVVTATGEYFVAEHVIVAVSLGVLQHGLIKFEPDLPLWKWDSIHGFQMGNYLHFYLSFPFVFWDDEQYILYASPNRGRYTTWLNIDKLRPGSRILNCAVTQYEADRLLTLTDAEIQAEAMEALRNMYGEVIPEPLGIVVPRFGSDPFFMGTYSNWPPGYTNETHHALSASVGRLHFAGEYASFR